MTSSPQDRRAVARPTATEAWSKPQREEWRLQFFKEQIALEAERRRQEGALHRAVLIGSIGGLVIAGVSFFF